MRQSARRQAQNKTVKTRLKTLERNYLEAVKGGKKDEAAKLYVSMTSAFDKAAKVGVIHKAKASRKKSRLSAHLKAAAPAAAPQA